MDENRYGGHTVSRMTVHLVWVTKYRYKVLEGDVKKRCRELLIQICDAEDVRILSGVVRQPGPARPASSARLQTRRMAGESTCGICSSAVSPTFIGT